MSTTTKVSTNTKYRVAIRVIGIDNGWKFDQISTSTDRFTKGKTVVDVVHSPTNLISTAEKVEGNSHTQAGSQGKMFTVQAWLTGVADPIDSKTGKGKRFIRLTPEQVLKFESGKGVALIKTLDTAAAASKEAPATAAS